MWEDLEKGLREVVGSGGVREGTSPMITRHLIIGYCTVQDPRVVSFLPVALRPIFPDRRAIRCSHWHS